MLVKWLLCVFIGVVVGTWLGDDASLQEARRIMQENPLIDGHNDLPWQYRSQWEDRVYTNSTDLTTLVPTLQTDIPRLRSGEVQGQFWSVYVSCSHQVSSFYIL